MEIIRIKKEIDVEDDEEEEKDDIEYQQRIRLVVGGLLFPSVAICLDRLILRPFKLIKSSSLRFAVVSVSTFRIETPPLFCNNIYNLRLG